MWSAQVDARWARDSKSSGLGRYDDDVIKPVGRLLPSGWNSAIDTDTGWEYFWEEDDPDGTTTWERPEWCQAETCNTTDELSKNIGNSSSVVMNLVLEAQRLSQKEELNAQQKTAHLHGSPSPIMNLVLGAQRLAQEEKLIAEQKVVDAVSLCSSAKVFATADTAQEKPAQDAAGTLAFVQVQLPSLTDTRPIGIWLQEDLQGGLCVRQVTPGSVFAGHIHVGDRIVSANGRPVADNASFQARLELARRSSPRRFSVTIFTSPPEKEDAPAIEKPDCKALQRKKGTKISLVATKTPSLNSDLVVSPGIDKRMDSPKTHSAVDSKIHNCPKDKDVVLNCEDIGWRSNSNSSNNSISYRQKRREFFWEGVEAAVTYYEKRGYVVQAVVLQSTASRHPPPASLEKVLVRSPVMDECPEPFTSERLFVLRLAQVYNCIFVDNWNYRECNGHSDALCQWMQKIGFNKKIEYIFDRNVFVPLRTGERASNAR